MGAFGIFGAFFGLVFMLIGLAWIIFKTAGTGTCLDETICRFVDERGKK